MLQFPMKSRRGALNNAHLVATQPPGYPLRAGRLAHSKALRLACIRWASFLASQVAELSSLCDSLPRSQKQESAPATVTPQRIPDPLA